MSRRSCRIYRATCLGHGGRDSSCYTNPSLRKLSAGAVMYVDVFIAAVSAAVLIYSGSLLAPAAHLRPDDIVGQVTTRFSLLEGMTEVYPQFPMAEIEPAI